MPVSTSSFRIVVLLSLALLLGASATWALPKRPPVTFDDLLAEVGRLEPAFGGISLTEGRLSVVMTDTARDLATLRAALGSILRDHRFETGPLDVRQGDYSFLQLYAWSLKLPAFFSIEGVFSIDIDEAQNRLKVGIRDDSVREAIETELAWVGIPSEAVIFEVREPAVFALSLREEVRMIIGGVQIDFPLANAPCTLGFNTIYNGQRVFATNGHCSSWTVSGDGTPYWQPTRNLERFYVGNELVESRVIGNADDPRCPVGAQCKWSDLSLGAYIPAYETQQSYGHIARTIDRTRYGGSVTVDLSYPSIPIESENLFPLQGETVDKVGRTTGWTYGPVLSTCETTGIFDSLSGRTIYLVCHHTVDAGVNGGDSGSAVFTYNPTTKYGTMAGQLFGRRGTTVFLFSPLNNMQAEFGNLITTIYGW